MPSGAPFSTSGRSPPPETRHRPDPLRNDGLFFRISWAARRISTSIVFRPRARSSSRLHDLTLEFSGENAPPIGLPWKLTHGTSSRVILTPKVCNRNWVHSMWVKEVEYSRDISSNCEHLTGTASTTTLYDKVLRDAPSAAARRLGQNADTGGSVACGRTCC